MRARASATAPASPKGLPPRLGKVSGRGVKWQAEGSNVADEEEEAGSTRSTNTPVAKHHALEGLQRGAVGEGSGEGSDTSIANVVVVETAAG